MLIKTYEMFICFCLHPLELAVLNNRLCLTKEQQLRSRQIPSEYLSRGLDDYCSFCSHLRPLRCPFVSSASRPETSASLPRIRGGKGEYSRHGPRGYELSVIICRLTTDRSLVLWTDPSRPPDPLSSATCPCGSGVVCHRRWQGDPSTGSCTRCDWRLVEPGSSCRLPLCGPYAASWSPVDLTPTSKGQVFSTSRPTPFHPFS